MLREGLVLSKATKRISRPRSNASRFRTRMPFFAARAVAFTVTRGMARPRAWGQAMTTTVTARERAKLKSRPRASQTRKVRVPRVRAM